MANPNIPNKALWLKASNPFWRRPYNRDGAHERRFASSVGSTSVYSRALLFLHHVDTMTRQKSPTQPLDASAAQALQPEAQAIEPTPEVTGEAATKPAIPAFKFPFSPASFAPGKNDNQGWHGKGNKPGHEKKIGPAPNGTRRSMGKR